MTDTTTDSNGQLHQSFDMDMYFSKWFMQKITDTAAVHHILDCSRQIRSAITKNQHSPQSFVHQRNRSLHVSDAVSLDITSDVIRIGHLGTAQSRQK